MQLPHKNIVKKKYNKKNPMRKKQSQIIKILFLLITAASLPSSSKQAISTKTTCTKSHCTVCKLDESCITCESGWSAQGSPDCFKCAEGCLSCSGPKASSCDGSCESGWKHKPGEGCVKKGGANAVTIIVIIVIIVFLCMVAYVCYKSFKGKKGIIELGTVIKRIGE